MPSETESALLAYLRQAPSDLRCSCLTQPHPGFLGEVFFMKLSDFKHPLRAIPRGSWAYDRDRDSRLAITARAAAVAAHTR